MAFDAHKNLAITTVATAPAPATSGTTLTVAVGEGARFPAAPFNVTVWPAAAIPTPVNAEVVRVTARTGDVLTITRAQEGTTARSIIAGDLIAQTITAKTLTDIESGTNFPLLTTPGTVTVGGDVVFTNPTAAVLRANTSDGADTAFFQFASGGAGGATRGACFNLFGNENANVGREGSIDFIAGNTPSGKITFQTGTAVIRGIVHASGGLSWGGTTDPGAGAILVGGPIVVGTQFVSIGAGSISLGTNTTAAHTPINFVNPNGAVGSITIAGSATAYNTTSDARLKTSLNRHTDPAVLRDTVIHDFLWKADGTPGRGVFAQEAQLVAPFVVSVGTDERDESGNLWHPWGVDYSKYVPDLITGWQDHDARLLELTDLVETNVALMERITALEARRPVSAMTLSQSLQVIPSKIAAWLRAWVPSWV